MPLLNACPAASYACLVTRVSWLWWQGRCLSNSCPNGWVSRTPLAQHQLCYSSWLCELALWTFSDSGALLWQPTERISPLCAAAMNCTRAITHIHHSRLIAISLYPCIWQESPCCSVSAPKQTVQADVCLQVIWLPIDYLQTLTYLKKMSLANKFLVSSVSIMTYRCQRWKNRWC